MKKIYKMKFCKACKKEVIHLLLEGYLICEKCGKKVKEEKKKNSPLMITSYRDDFGIKFGPYVRNKEWE